MSRKADFSKMVIDTHGCRSNRRVDKPEAKNPIQKLGSETNRYEENLKIIGECYPNKILFSQMEAAKLLGVSYQMINRYCKSGLIIWIPYGSLIKIHISEIARMLTNGVKNGNSQT
ncbi:MAG: helix-turn-helix domain-containing protein [Melioribacteraceae bacterium]|nr:helix-turn-helix domain-containing protein [Melioribacteraceae bacterium]